MRSRDSKGRFIKNNSEKAQKKSKAKGERKRDSKGRFIIQISCQATVALYLSCRS